MTAKYLRREIVTAIHDAPDRVIMSGGTAREVLARFAGDEVPLADGWFSLHKGDYASTFLFRHLRPASRSSGRRARTGRS